MKRIRLIVLVGILLGIIYFVLIPAITCRFLSVDEYIQLDTLPAISPDYTNTVIPPNIAPLNFSIKEPGVTFLVFIHSETGKKIKVVSKKNKIIIPQKKWQKLLDENKGKKLYFDIYIKNTENKWARYDSIVNSIAENTIDPYVVYRFMTPSSYFPKKMRLYQRNLTSYDNSVILDSKAYGNGCFNCHTFLNNSPEKMLLGIRSFDFGNNIISIENGKVNKIGAKFGYSSWHPSGRMVTYSINDVQQLYHLSGGENHGVLDTDSAINYYRSDMQVIKISPEIADKSRLETYPTWAPDGKTMYFCSADMPWKDKLDVYSDNYNQDIYDLMRISYDIQTDTWGQPKSVLSSNDIGKSILLPRVSPDGRYILLCLTDYGCFPIYQPSSDLYLYDLEKKTLAKMDINSSKTEAWHSFSSDGRWIVFSSKRRDGIFTHLYFSYFDREGKAHKPFILPQKNPDYYDSLPMVYSLPELIVSPINFSQLSLARPIRSPKKLQITVPITQATPKKQDYGNRQQIRE